MNFTVTAFGLDQLHARSAQLVQLAQQLPPAGARPVTIAGRVGGWICSRALAAIGGMPGVLIEDEAAHLAPAGDMSLDTVLCGLARRLDDAGCIRNWRNELLDVIAEGQVLGRVERGAIRPLGLLSQAVHLNGWTPDGRLWVARRALDKSTDPGMWDTLSGGLVAAGESPHQAMLRETLEEAGLVADELAGHGPLRTVLRMHRRLPDGYQVENVLLVDCVLDADVMPRNVDGEVLAFRCVGPDDLWQMIVDGAFTLEAELCILDSLQHRLQQSAGAA